MIDPSTRTVVLQLGETDKLGPVTIDSANFEIFEDALDERLDMLVAEWKHVASPSAQRIRRSIPKA